MTTPARNLNATSHKLVLSRWKQKGRYGWGNWSSWAPMGNYAVNVERYIRPESGNAQRDHGLLKCREWECRAGNLSLFSSQEKVMEDLSWIDTVNLVEYDGTPMACQVLLADKEPVEPSNNMVNYAMVKAKNKLKDQDFHLGNFIGEWHQTSNLLKTNADRIAKQISKFRKKYPKEFAKARVAQVGSLKKGLWCTIPNSWLELQYGWIPLMNDIQGAIAHLYKTANRRGLANVIVTASTTDTVVKETSLQVTTPAQISMWRGTTSWVSDQKVQVSLAYKISNWNVAELSSLGLINPLEIIWETTRFSFVLDWFLPIGPWLGSLTGDAGMEFVTGSVSRFSRSYNSGHYALKPEASWATLVDDGNPHVSGSLIIFKRSCLTSTPFPGLYVKNPISRLHVANALALLIQAFRR